MQAWKICLILVLFSFSGVCASEEILFYIKLKVAIEGDYLSESAPTGFRVKENEYGRISVTFERDLRNFNVTNSGTRQMPLPHLHTPGANNDNPDDLHMMLDIYLTPRVAPNKQIQVSGFIQKHTRNLDSSPALFSFAEETFDIPIDSGGSYRYSIPSGIPGKNVILTITPEARTTLIYAPHIDRRINFRSEYSLYNLDNGSAVISQCKCVLGFVGDGESGEGHCMHRQMFDLPGGDSVLFLVLFSIDQVQWNSDQAITLEFAVKHIYLVNPETADIDIDDYKADQVGETMLKKSFTVRPGEHTEIEIPADKNSPLPFDWKETIVLTNWVRENQN